MMNAMGTRDFYQRFGATEASERLIKPYLRAHEFEICDYGQLALLKDQEEASELLSDRASKRSLAALVVKFAPDCIGMDLKSNRLFFIDFKTSLTPVILDGAIEKIRIQAGRSTLRREQIGVVEREAWDNYTNVYPADRTIIEMACPYNPRILLMEWVAKLSPLFRYSGSVNYKSEGSGTPHVNIDLDSMRTVPEFLAQEFGRPPDTVSFNAVCEEIKKWPLSYPYKYRDAFIKCVPQLRVTCPWVTYE